MTDEATASNPNEGGILAEKVSRALQVRTDTVAMKAALEALQSFETLDSRTVRTAMEQDALHQAMQLQKSLKTIVQTVTELRQGCTQVAQTAAYLGEIARRSVIAVTTEPTMMQHTTKIDTIEIQDADAEQQLAKSLAAAFQERDLARKRLEAVQSFAEKYNLSEQDDILLDTYNFEDIEETGIDFLAALERVREIRQALSQTFEFEGVAANSALRMMENLSQKQERAYERLYVFLQNHLEDDEFILHGFVSNALATLRHVPAFYAHTLELMAAARRAHVTKQFLLALTAGTDDSPPMEMRAHDSVAYVGDMLAFSFKSFSVEADLAKSLLLQPEQEEQDEEESSQPISTETILSIAVSGLARPLKSRILQVISTLARRADESNEVDSDDGLHDDLEEEGTLICTKLMQIFEICGLLLFYSNAMEKTVEKLKDQDDAEPNLLIESLRECLGEGSKAFEATIRVYSAMLEYLAITGDSVALLVQQLLTKIASVRRNSPGFEVELSDRILSVDWLTETMLTTALPKCTTLDDVVALKQSLLKSKEAGMRVTTAEQLDQMIDVKSSSLIDDFVENESSQVFDMCGLSGIVDAWKRWKDVQHNNITMASYPGLSKAEMEVAMKEFYASLYSPPLPSLENVVKDPAVRRVVRSNITTVVCDTYGVLYESVTSNGGYDDLGFLGHTPEQVRTLFSV